jgi:exodeoxyribonuclease VII small subunit
MTEPRDEPLKFETALQRLEQIVQKLEKGDLPLEESLVLYEEGIRLSRHCHGKLEEAEGKIEVLMKDARGDLTLDRDGKAQTKPFAPSAAAGGGDKEPPR